MEVAGFVGVDGAVVVFGAVASEVAAVVGVLGVVGVGVLGMLEVLLDSAFLESVR